MKRVFLALWLSTAAVTLGSPSVMDLPAGSLVERAAALARDLEVLCSHSIFMEFAKRKTRLTRVVWQAKGQTEAAAQLRRIYLAEPILQAKSNRFWPQSLPPMDLKARCFWQDLTARSGSGPLAAAIQKHYPNPEEPAAGPISCPRGGPEGRCLVPVGQYRSESGVESGRVVPVVMYHMSETCNNANQHLIPPHLRKGSQTGRQQPQQDRTVAHC